MHCRLCEIHVRHPSPPCSLSPCCLVSPFCMLLPFCLLLLPLRFHFYLIRKVNMVQAVYMSSGLDFRDKLEGVCGSAGRKHLIILVLTAILEYRSEPRLRASLWGIYTFLNTSLKPPTRSQYFTVVMILRLPNSCSDARCAQAFTSARPRQAQQHPSPRASSPTNHPGA